MYLFPSNEDLVYFDRRGLKCPDEQTNESFGILYELRQGVFPWPLRIDGVTDGWHVVVMMTVMGKRDADLFVDQEEKGKRWC